MEMNYLNYRINQPEGTDDVWVYRNKVLMMHLLQSYKQTDQELLKDVREIMRILDM